MSVIGKVQFARDYMDQLKNELDTKPKHADPSTTIADVDKKIALLVAETKSIFATPAPKVEVPAPEQEKKEEESKAGEQAQSEPPAADLDQEMK